MKKLGYILKTMRPRQWIKNLFVFPALLFSKSFMNIKAISLSIAAFLLFCLASGAVYIINDVIDRKKDVLHPRKCKRPVAAGLLSIKDALSVCAIITITVILSAAFISLDFMAVIVFYILLMLLYSWRLKSVPLLDIMAIACGFVLRTLAGAVIIGVKASSWLLFCTSALCLFLAANKRRMELETMKEYAADYKSVLSVYTLPFLTQLIDVCITLCIIFYALYTHFTGIHFMMGTTVFVIYGLFRYQLLKVSIDADDNIESAVLGDKPLLVDIALWGLSCLAIIWRFY
jgi:4-hydroxybenzoate polyprenyltransferase